MVNLDCHKYVNVPCDMSYYEKVKSVFGKVSCLHISGGELAREYFYGENPYADMLIENALFCDMYPEDVFDVNDFFGFCRSDYSLRQRFEQEGRKNDIPRLP